MGTLSIVIVYFLAKILYDYRVGVLYMLERQFVLVKGEFQRALELDPAHQHANDYLEQLKNY